MRSAFRGTGATRESCRETSPMILPPASATLTRKFPRPKCFSATSKERTAHEHSDSQTESDDPGQYPVHRLPRLHGRVQILERTAGGPYRFFRRRRLSEPARSRRQQLHAYLHCHAGERSFEEQQVHQAIRDQLTTNNPSCLTCHNLVHNVD